MSRLILAIAVLIMGYAVLVALAMTLAISPLITLVIFGAILFRLRKRKPTLTAYGTARISEDRELRKAGFIGGRDGLIVGRTAPDQSKLRAVWRLLAGGSARRFLEAFSGRDKGDVVRLKSVHTAVFAPTRAGKGVSCILPWIYQANSSFVCIDPKGENALITADYLRRKGFEVVILDPYKEITQ
jgi:type IV secretion system protein VirD4